MGNNTARDAPTEEDVVRVAQAHHEKHKALRVAHATKLVRKWTKCGAVKEFTTRYRSYSTDWNGTSQEHIMAAFERLDDDWVVTCTPGFVRFVVPRRVWDAVHPNADPQADAALLMVQRFVSDSKALSGLTTPNGLWTSANVQNTTHAHLEEVMRTRFAEWRFTAAPDDDNAFTFTTPSHVWTKLSAKNDKEARKQCRRYQWYNARRNHARRALIQLATKGVWTFTQLWNDHRHRIPAALKYYKHSNDKLTAARSATVVGGVKWTLHLDDE